MVLQYIYYIHIVRKPQSGNAFMCSGNTVSIGYIFQNLFNLYIYSYTIHLIPKQLIQFKKMYCRTFFLSVI